ncbi:MAG: spore germination protein [Candidatus Desulforudis sp.]|nr:spore germination protein [Desulforudis sp.]
MLLIDYAFELLREAGIRLPRPVGQAVSIVGALVVGRAAIQAGLISPLGVIVVALTGIASFVVPIFSMAFAQSQQFCFWLYRSTMLPAHGRHKLGCLAGL